MSSIRVRGIRHLALAVLCVWILGVLVGLADLFQTSDIFFLESSELLEDADLFSGDRRIEEIKSAIDQRRYHMVTREMFNQQILTNTHNDSVTRIDQRKHRVHRSRRRKKRQRLPPQNFTLPKPVIVVGFPKAGTSSIFNFFRKQPGYLKCQHWYCCGDQADPQMGGPELMAGCMLHNLVHNLSIFENCGNFDVYTEINGPRSIKGTKHRHNVEYRPGLLQDDGTLDTESYDESTGTSTRMFFPQYFNLEDIHRSYPNATFILNTRPFDSWIKSVQTWGIGLDWQFVNEFYHRGELSSLPHDKTNKTEMAGIMRIIYDRHHERIKSFVMAHPSHALIEVPITDPEAGKILGEALGLDSTPWGKYNENGMGRMIRNDFAFLDQWVAQLNYKDPSSIAAFVCVFSSIFTLCMAVMIRCLLVLCFRCVYFYRRRRRLGRRGNGQRNAKIMKI